MADKVKVVGYAQRVFYDNGIEYRNFSDDLVGNQFTSNGGNTLFTSANFNITSTLDTKPSKIFLTNKFSPFMSLCDISADAATISFLNDTGNIKLNLDKSNLCYYAYFGSLTEFIRVSLEDIIIKWPASIYVRDIDPNSSITGYTVEDYEYDFINDKSSFKVEISRLTNKFNINHKVNGSLLNTYNEENPLRNLTVNYADYVIANETGDYSIIDFTGNTNDTNDYLWFTCSGNAFSGATASTENYHVRPKNTKIEEFFATLPDFESNLLNRFTYPKYKSEYSFNIESDTGAIYRTSKEVIWPVTDGYNIDFDTTDYVTFVTSLLQIGEASDGTKTDLITRFLTAESISDFDTLPNCEGEVEETAGQKMNKTLKIYGREYDEIKKYIDGIAFSNTVTYDKKDNTPDAYLKGIARVLGWELVSSVLENDLLKDFLTPKDTSYSGHARGYTAAEAEIELWRRLILNTPWIWKSKGTRKVVEFFFNFIGTPNGLVAFNEYIYKVRKPLDIELFKDILFEIYGDTSLEGLNIDSEGYPRVFPDNPEMYFQKAGLWYRQTAGPAANIDILDGNNPHIGPYDGGQAYIDQFGCLIPDFTAVTIHNETISTSETNIFTNYNSGLVNNHPETEVWADLVNLDNISLSACYEMTAEFIEDPKPTTEVTDCGCETGEGDDAIRINVKKLDGEVSVTPTPVDCGYTGITLDEGGYVIFSYPNGKQGFLISQECCEALGFTYQTGNINCYWGDTATVDIKACNGFVPDKPLSSGLIPWTNNELQIGTTEVSQECCNAYGYVAVQTPIGTYECYASGGQVDCTNYVYTSVSTTTGIITWQNPPNKALTTNISPECCTALGYQPSGKGECIDPNAIQQIGPIITKRISGDKI